MFKIVSWAAYSITGIFRIGANILPSTVKSPDVILNCHPEPVEGAVKNLVPARRETLRFAQSDMSPPKKGDLPLRHREYRVYERFVRM